MIGSSLVIVVVLCTGLVAYYNGARPQRSSTIGPPELSYVPADASGVAFANVDEITKSAFFKKIQAEMPTGQGKEELREQTGIDIEHDIDDVVSGIGAKTSATESVSFLRGHFKVDDVQKAIVAHGGTSASYQGVQLYTMPAGAPAPKAGVEVPTAAPPAATTWCVAFLEPGLLAIGAETAIKRAIDVHASHDDVTKDPDMMKLIASMAGTTNLWAVGRFDALTKDVNLPQQALSQIPPISWLAFSASVTDNVNGRVYAETKDEQSGDQLRAVVNGALAAAKMMASNNQKVTSALNALQATGTGKSVELAFTVSPELLDELHGNLPGLTGPQNMPTPSHTSVQPRTTAATH
jgi:hypothetical protein